MKKQALFLERVYDGAAERLYLKWFESVSETYGEYVDVYRLHLV